MLSVASPVQGHPDREQMFVNIARILGDAVGVSFGVHQM